MMWYLVTSTVGLAELSWYFGPTLMWSFATLNGMEVLDVTQVAHICITRDVVTGCVSSGFPFIVDVCERL